MKIRAAVLLAFPGCAAFAVAIGAAARPAPPAQEVAPAVATGRSLSAVERAEVLKGRIVLREIPEPARKGRTYEALGVLPATLDEALSVITDYRGYPGFMPRVDRVVVTDEGGSVSLVEQHLRLPLGVEKRYRLRYSFRRLEEGFRVDWAKVAWPELTAGQTVADTSGYWLVGRFPEGGLLACYHVYTDPGRVPLGMKGLALSISRHEIPKVLERVRQRIRSIAAPRPGRG